MRRGAVVVFLATGAALAVAALPAGLGIAAAAGAVLASAIVMRSGRPRVVATAPAVQPSRVEPSEEASDWLETVPCGVLLLDDDLVVVGANEAALDLCGRDRREVEGVSLIRAIRDHNIAQIARESSGTPEEVDVRDGQMVRATATRLDEPIAGARHVLALEDLTELRDAQRARSDLIANASHELRTPVTAALALAETLELGVSDESLQQDFHQRLTGEISRLSEIIEGLLNLSRVESGSDEFVIEPLRPRELLETAARRIEPLLAAGQSLEIVDESTTLVDGDRERVLEVLANLLDNALRVSPNDGLVKLTAVPGDGEVQFEVRDQGPGIILRDRTRVFERFYTGDESRTASSGLGLAIARHIVTRQGGRIWVADEAPGATLCFTLPASRSGAGTANAARASSDLSTNSSSTMGAISETSRSDR